MWNNIECFEAYHVGRDVGVIPDPCMDRTFTDYLSLNSSVHLSSHYMDVRHSLSPEQLGTFNHSLRATLGESGKMTQGGVGVVALALSLLFDVLAQQAKNQTGTTHFIHRIFREHEDGNSSETGTVVNDYLQLVPLIANDPQRMKEETNRYEQRLNNSLVSHVQSAVMLQNSSWTAWKILFYGIAFHQHTMIHQVRMGADIPTERLRENVLKYLDRGIFDHLLILNEITNGVERLRSISPEKYQLVSKCPNLRDIFMMSEFGEVVFFMSHYDGNVSHLLSQKENFFY